MNYLSSVFPSVFPSVRLEFSNGQCCHHKHYPSTTIFKGGGPLELHVRIFSFTSTADVGGECIIWSPNPHCYEIYRKGNGLIYLLEDLTYIVLHSVHVYQDYQELMIQEPWVKATFIRRPPCFFRQGLVDLCCQFLKIE